MSTKLFMQEFRRKTWPNPFNNGERVLFNSVALRLCPSSEHIILLGIRSLIRGQGHASKALDWVCGLADKHNLEVTGYIEPYGLANPRLNIPQLKAWYKRHGFIVKKRQFIRRSQCKT